MLVKEVDSIGIRDNILTPHQHEDLSGEISVVPEASGIAWWVVTVD